MLADFDVLVIGSGAGGACFAQRCAAAGRRVLLLERGYPAPPPDGHDEQATLIEKRSYDDRPVSVNGVPLRLYMGGVVGGSTSLYGGVMLRPAKEDFAPGKHYADRLPKELWEWPIDYASLEPYFCEAESLFGLAGDPADSFHPLPRPNGSLSPEVIPLAPINQRLMERNRRRGLRPFRLPLAIDTKKCRQCDHCAGFLCPHDARRSSQHVIQLAQTAGLQLRTGVEVQRIESQPAGQTVTVHATDRQTGQPVRLSARHCAVAAGAIGSAAILLRSGFQHPQLGRNYMMHYSPLAMGVFAGSTGADERFVKQVGFADFYFGTPKLPEKMGLVQSLPAPGPLMLKKAGMKRMPGVGLRFLRRRMLPLVGIVEDLPNPENRVTLGGDGKIALTQEFSQYDRARGNALGREMCRILRRAGAIVTVSKSFPSQEHVAHQCGTARMGRTDQHAVTSADCRLFADEKITVVDGSVLPTSLGVGPSLTIAANALRVADGVLREL